MKIGIICMLFGLNVLLFNIKVIGQDPPQFGIKLEALSIPGLGGLQSYAYGIHGGKIVVIGGRLDGLHRRQPWASFDIDGHNTNIMVIDPDDKKVWKRSIIDAPALIREQLKSTNMQFIQNGDDLILTGGYGYSETVDDHITFGQLVVVDIPQLINAVVNDSEMTNVFRHVKDDHVRLTGGQLQIIDDVYYIVGGQLFLGRYNPMGPDHGPGFIQRYSDGFRKFTLDLDDDAIKIKDKDTFYDVDLFHRRDFNLLPYVDEHNDIGLTLYSGVFHVNRDIPYTNCTNISSQGYRLVENFNQYLNHYHSAKVNLFSVISKKNYAVFFGGIAQYYFQNDTLVQDNNIPFVRTIGVVDRDYSGSMNEYYIEDAMPDYIGTGAEFIPMEDLVYKNGIIDYDKIKEEITPIGYIYGGIKSDKANIFWDNEGDLSTATSTIYKVYLEKVDRPEWKVNPYCNSKINLRVYPSNALAGWEIDYTLNTSTAVNITIYDSVMNVIKEVAYEEMWEGEYTELIESISILEKGDYYIRFETKDESVFQKVVVDL